jgi:hypothetical protein
MTQLRNDHDTYEALWLLFGPAVIGATEWCDHAGSSAMTTLLTVSDEAFVLVVLKNYHTRWDAMVERTAAGYSMVRQTALPRSYVIQSASSS